MIKKKNAGTPELWAINNVNPAVSPVYCSEFSEHGTEAEPRGLPELKQWSWEASGVKMLGFVGHSSRKVRTTGREKF